MKPPDNKLKKMGIVASFAIFVPAAILLFVVTKFLIPYLSALTGQENILFWFIAGGLGVFVPLIITGLIILRAEGYAINRHTIVNRLRFRRITKNDLWWSLAGLVLTGIATGIVMLALSYFAGDFNHTPPFMAFEPLSSGRYWLLLVWAPYWILNIMGEEFLWRGVMLPRQEAAHRNFAWLVHGLGWGIFHIAFGWQLLIMLLPLVFIQSYIVQRTQNSWVGVIMHGGMNGPGFIAISLGLI